MILTQKHFYLFLSSLTKFLWCSMHTTCTRSLPSSPTAMNTSLLARHRHTCPRRSSTQRRVRHIRTAVLSSLRELFSVLTLSGFHLQVFPARLTHRSSRPTTPCLPELWGPLLTLWAGSCHSKFFLLSGIQNWLFHKVL